jgi:hypothetical protein
MVLVRPASPERRLIFFLPICWQPTARRQAWAKENPAVGGWPIRGHARKKPWRRISWRYVWVITFHF